MPSVLAADCVKAIAGKSRSTEVSLVLASGMTQGQLGYVDTAGPGRGSCHAAECSSWKCSGYVQLHMGKLTNLSLVFTL